VAAVFTVKYGPAIGVYLTPSIAVHDIVMLELVMPVTVTGTIAGVVLAVKGSETAVNPLAVAVTVITGVEPGVNPEIHLRVLGIVVDDPAVNVETAEVPVTAEVYVVPVPAHGHVTVVLVKPQVL